VAYLKHFVFEIEVNYPQHEVLNFCQQALLNLPFVKWKTLFLFIQYFSPTGTCSSFSCPLLQYEIKYHFSYPLLQYEKVGNFLSFILTTPTSQWLVHLMQLQLFTVNAVLLNLHSFLYPLLLWGESRGQHPKSTRNTSRSTAISHSSVGSTSIQGQARSEILSLHLVLGQPQGRVGVTRRTSLGQYFVGHSVHMT